VATILFFFLIIIASLLLVSFHISLQLLKKGSLTQGSFRIRWLGITFIHRKIPQEEKKEKKKAKEKKKDGFNWRNITEIGSLFTESSSSFVDVFNAFTKSISIKRLSINANIGLGSAAETAIMSGYMYLLTSIASTYPPINISVEPDFQKERLDGSIMIELKIRLLRIAIAFIKAFTKKPVRRLIRRMRE
jgi:hypothetical protein